MAPRHAAKEEKSSGKARWIVGGLATVLVLGVVATLVVTTTSPPSSDHASTTGATKSFSVVTTTPSNNAVVDSSATVRVAMSEAISSTSPLPTISPEVAGSWQRLSPTTLEFVQTAPFSPGQNLTVTVPGGDQGITSTSGRKLSASATSTFSVAGMSLTRVQQLLAEENYLPVAFTPSVPTGSIAGTAEELGTFSWRFSEFPQSLKDLWAPGAMTTVTKGAIMRFQDVHQMTTDGAVSPQLEAALLADRAAGKVDPNPYTWVLVHRALPQTLQLYSNGALDYTARVNLGIPGEDTPSGTWPVYLRYRTQTMSGTNPDGSHYEDPGVPFVSYFVGGVALHGFPRASYGSPQSLGCVEMTDPDAEHVWPLTPIGTIVNVD